MTLWIFVKDFSDFCLLQYNELDVFFNPTMKTKIWDNI